MQRRWVAGRAVFMTPDADAHRFRCTAARVQNTPQHSSWSPGAAGAGRSRSSPAQKSIQKSAWLLARGLFFWEEDGGIGFFRDVLTWRRCHSGRRARTVSTMHSSPSKTCGTFQTRSLDMVFSFEVDGYIMVERARSKLWHRPEDGALYVDSRGSFGFSAMALGSVRGLASGHCANVAWL